MIRLSPRALLAGLLVTVLAACAAPMPSMPPPATQPADATAAPAPAAYPGWQLPQDGGELVPIPVTSELAVGENRFLLNLVDAENEPLAAPDRPVTLRFFDLAADPAAPASSVEATYLPTIPQLPGLYRATVEFTRAGPWGIEVESAESDGTTRKGRMIFSVRPTSSTPPIGADAPATTTPTATSADEIAAISSDQHPRPEFYRLSVDEALANDQPFLLFFGTPAFCRTATCGPAMEIVKDVATDYEGEVAVIHVEPYELHEADGQLQPVLREGQLVPVPAVAEWGLLTEPMIFAVDAEGKVRAKLEGVASEEEVREAMETVAP